MVRVFYLGLFFAAVVCALVATLGAAAPVHHRSHKRPGEGIAPEDDGQVRSQRSTNLSHITGSSRKIQMFFKNWQLQVLPEGIVNGTTNDFSDYTIMQRTTVNTGQLKIQGIATCQYLCMDSCGLLYASRDFTDECIFNEVIEQHHYNTYASNKYSNARRTMYLGLNRWGQPRRVQVRAHQPLGKLSTYARVLTKTVSIDRVQDLLTRMANVTTVHPLRHHGGLHPCWVELKTSGTNVESTGVIGSAGSSGTVGEWQGDRLRCRKRKKRKKKRRKCKEGEGIENECVPKKKAGGMNSRKGEGRLKKKECNEEDSSSNSNKKCQRLGGNNNNNKSEIVTARNKNKNNVKNKKKKQLPGAARATKEVKNVKKTLRARMGTKISNNNKGSDRKIAKKVLPVFRPSTTTLSPSTVNMQSVTVAINVQNMSEEFLLSMENTHSLLNVTEFESFEENLSGFEDYTTIRPPSEDSHSEDQSYDDEGASAASSAAAFPSAEVVD